MAANQRWVQRPRRRFMAMRRQSEQPPCLFVARPRARVSLGTPRYIREHFTQGDGQVSHRNAGGIVLGWVRDRRPNPRQAYLVNTTSTHRRLRIGRVDVKDVDVGPSICTAGT